MKTSQQSGRGMGRGRHWRPAGRRTAALVVALVTMAASAVAGSGGSPAGAETATIHEYALPTAGAHPTGITRGPGHTVWFSERGASKVGRITTTGSLKEFAVGGNPTGITLGPGGRVWFIEPEAAMIGRISPSGALAEFPAPSLFFPQGDFEGITKGPDGNIWYTDAANQVVGHISPTGKKKTERIVPGGPFDITTGPDGNLWFTETQQAAIGRVSPTLGNLVEFPVPTLVQFPVASPGARLAGIANGPDHNLWFTDSTNNRIGRITPAGAITLFPVPTTGSGLADITAGPDGNMWFTESVGNRIGRITPSGTVTEIHVPTPLSLPQGITTGPDGKLWFTEAASGKVASLDPTTIKPPPAPCLTVTQDTVLNHDVGPCAGDGILVAADNVSLDLAGHRVFAAKGPRVGDFAGIHLEGVHGVTVTGGGRVTGFDAGVLLNAASGNTIKGLHVHDNFGALDTASTLGDGIAVFHSDHNRIIGNSVFHNGIYDGIGVLGLGSAPQHH